MRRFDILVVVLVVHLIHSTIQEDIQEAHPHHQDPPEPPRNQENAGLHHVMVPDGIPSEEAPLESNPEELPTPEAYHGGRRWRPLPPLIRIRNRPLLLDAPSHNAPPPRMDDLYTSSLNDVQQEKLPRRNTSSGAGGGGEEVDDCQRRRPCTNSAVMERDPLISEESWQWLTSLVPRGGARRPNRRHKVQPYQRVQGRGRTRTRPRKVLNKGRFPTGRQKLRRPLPPTPYRPRPSLPPRHRPRFPGTSSFPVTSVPRRPPAPITFPVTDPTTTTPDTLSVHNIAGPPYLDTIPPNILFVDEEVTTPTVFQTTTYYTTTTPRPSSFETWVPVSSSEPRWTYKPTTGKSSVIETREEESGNPKTKNNKGDDWKIEGFDDADFNWGGQMDTRWLNFWNHNWGNEWGQKRSTEAPVNSPPPPTSGYAKPSGRINWEGGFTPTATDKPKDQNFHVIQSSDDTYLEGPVTKYKLPEETATTAMLPDPSLKNHRFPDSSSSIKFPDTSSSMKLPDTSSSMKFPNSFPSKPKIPDTARPSIKFSVVPPGSQKFPTTKIQNNFQDVQSGNSRHSVSFPGNQRLPEIHGGNRRISTVSDSQHGGPTRSPVRKRLRPYRPYSEEIRGSGTRTYPTKRPTTFRQSVRAPGRSRPSLRPVFTPRLPSRVWKQGRPVMATRERSRG